MAEEAVERVAPRPVPRRTVLTALAGGFVVATAITVLFVLPVEFQLDPTGFGRLTGLARLNGSGPSSGVRGIDLSELEAAAPPARMPWDTPPPASAAREAASGGAIRYYAKPFRTDTIEIPLTTPDMGRTGSELEYKVRMAAGDSLIYSWDVPDLSNPEEFYFDFHGETPMGPGNPEAKVIEYRQETGLQSNGVLIAPIPGVHGWYFKNSAPQGVVVRLKLSGFYELVPPGEYGNEASILPQPARN